MQYDFTTCNTGGGVHPFAAKFGATDPGILPYSVAEMRLELAPCIKDAMHRIVDRGSFGYAPPDKTAFDDALLRWMRERHDWQIDPAWMRQSPGVITAMGAAIRVLTEPGDGVLIQAPVYQHFAQEILQNGRVPVENPLICRDGCYTMDFDDLREKAKQAKLLLLCSPHNPVGRVWRREELETLGAICLEQELYVVSDDIHFDLDFTGSHRVLTQAVPALRDRTIVCTAPSKTFNLAGCSLSNIIVENEALRARFNEEMNRSCGFYVNTFAYAAAAAAYDGGGPWLDQLLVHLRNNRQLLAEGLKKILPQAVCSPLEGTYLQWIDLSPLGLPQPELMGRLEQAQVYVSDGADFGTGGAGHIRFNLACPASGIHAALDRLRGAFS